jgi:hypothetical protein
MAIQAIDMSCYKMLPKIQNEPPKARYTMNTKSSRSTEIERELGDSGTWVILTITRSIFLESFRSFGDLLHQGQTS